MNPLKMRHNVREIINIHKEVKSRLNIGDACYNLFQNLVVSHLFCLNT